MFENDVLITTGLKSIAAERLNEYIRSQFCRSKHARDCIRLQYMFEALEACKPDVNVIATEIANELKPHPPVERERYMTSLVECKRNQLGRKLFQIVRKWDDVVAECKR